MIIAAPMSTSNAAAESTAETTAAARQMQPQTADACGWCGDAPWSFSCMMCDPRRTKQVCTECAKRWHSRGFSLEHVLTNRTGQSQQFREWFRSFLATQQQQQQQCEDGMRQGNGAAESSSSPPVAELESGDGDAKTIDACAQDGEDQANRDAPASAEERTELRDAIADQPQQQQQQQPELLSSEQSPEIELPIPSGNADTNSAGSSAELDPAPVDVGDPSDKLLPLDALLELYPTEDERLIDMLSEHIDAAVRIQDAITCVRYVKCTQRSCTSVVEHFRHSSSNAAACDAECQRGLEMYQHMKACSKHGCPFCIRVRLRKTLNSIKAIDFLVLEQKRTMKRLAQDHKNGVSGVKPKYNFCMTQVQACERKKRQLIENVEQMNSIVLAQQFPIFNFPRPVWHIHNEPYIKREENGTLSISEPAIEEEKPAAQLPPTSTKPDADEEQTGSGDTLLPPSPPPGAESNQQCDLGEGDYIRALLTKKKTDPHAHKKFEESIELAYAVVEASFCSSSKAPRCLLQCQRVLDHLQHHLDLKVCEDMMCTTVEFHFAHLSLCKEEQRNDKCEYCLRVREREVTRALDVMEGEQREAEAKAQAVVDAMTASFASDSREEREVALIQLEDELDQAEEYKRDMAKKLTAARKKLRVVRERMEQLPDPIPTSILQKLPVHFVKVMRKEQHQAPSKRRKQ